MKNIRFLILAAVLVLFAACQDDDKAPVVQSIGFANLTENTLTLVPGQSAVLDVVTTPAGAEYSLIVSKGPNAGETVFDFDYETRTITAYCGGSGTITAIAPTETGHVEAVCTVVVNESVVRAGNPKKNLYFLYTRLASDVRTLNLMELAELEPPTANIKSLTSTQTDEDNFNLTSGNVISYRWPENYNQGASCTDKVHMELVNGDGSVVECDMTFKNASHLNVMCCCFAYQGYGYYHGGLFDSTPTGGWHSSEGNSGNHAGSSGGHPHYIFVDFKETYKMTGVELWRNNNDANGIEIYYFDSSAELPTSTYAGSSVNSGGSYTMNATGFAAMQDLAATGFKLWGECAFGTEGSVNQTVFEGPQISTRYMVVKLASGNRGNSFSLTEIYPYIVVD